MATLPPPWLDGRRFDSSKVTIEMVADVVCPYCHIGLNGHRALEASGTYAAMVDALHSIHSSQAFAKGGRREARRLRATIWGSIAR